MRKGKRILAFLLAGALVWGGVSVPSRVVEAEDLYMDNDPKINVNAVNILRGLTPTLVKSSSGQGVNTSWPNNGKNEVERLQVFTDGNQSQMEGDYTELFSGAKMTYDLGAEYSLSDLERLDVYYYRYRSGASKYGDLDQRTYGLKVTVSETENGTEYPIVEQQSAATVLGPNVFSISNAEGTLPKVRFLNIYSLSNSSHFSEIELYAKPGDKYSDDATNILANRLTTSGGDAIKLGWPDNDLGNRKTALTDADTSQIEGTYTEVNAGQKLSYSLETPIKTSNMNRAQIYFYRYMNAGNNNKVDVRTYRGVYITVQNGDGQEYRITKENDLASRKGGNVLYFDIPADCPETVDTINVYSGSQIKNGENFSHFCEIEFYVTNEYEMKAEVATGCEDLGEVSVDQSSVKNGTPVTFTATPYYGSRFEGWYTSEDASEGTLESAEETYTCTVDKKNKTLYAKFTPYQYKVSAFAFLERVATETPGMISGLKEGGIYDPNTEASLIAAANDMYQFSYWKDADSGKILSYSPDYAFPVRRDVNLQAVFTTTDQHYVTFRYPAMFGNGIVKTVPVTESGVTAPSGPQMYGYSFKNWRRVDSTDTVNGNGSITDITGNVTYIAQYEAIADFTITLSDDQGAFLDDASVKDKTVGEDSQITVTAPAGSSGSNFCGWYATKINGKDDTEERLVSTNTNYLFPVKSDVTLRPRYSEDATELAPVVAAVGISTRTQDASGGRDRIRTQLLYDNSKEADYQVVEAGILATATADSKGKLLLGYKPEDKIVSYTNSGLYQRGSLILNIKAAGTSNIYTRGYVIYKDKTNNKVYTIYTDVKTYDATSSSN